ncbi:hypothetical protein Q3W71_19325 [Micromonospora sp. C28SCA-DRY-2]|uniref:hypothetical protein n=1 Tax=Micromonospora sp. C28SCA-DRY-2 TaxID=3059522 RepID=UPI00267468EC|nr:hypothetical protein [Micromonospora sp. C28SCA-DRY-2]MDO3703822.1 hypothetical protein [Micromonospora sp. C28SCA-DRY-2]
MTVPAPRARRRPSPAARLLPPLLVVALLAPVALLFGLTWRHTDDDRALAARERLGVTYLSALAPVTDALVDAQSAAVAGRPVPGEPLTRAVEAAASVDARIGRELRSQERWAGLRAKLEALRDRPPAEPEAAFAAYGEVTDLLLDLYRKVRESSGLVRDPAADSFFLQDGAGQELPEAVVATGRLADLATLAARRPDTDRLRTATELAALRAGALTPAGDLVADLRAAVDSTESTDLGANVLTPLDTYQRAVEALAAASTPAERTGVVDPAQIAAARLNAQAAATELQPVILAELDALLAGRVDALDRDRRFALGAVGLAVLLLAALGGVLLAAARRARRRAAEARQARAQADAAPESDAWRPRSGSRPDEPHPLQPAGPAGDPALASWGSVDAAR